MRVCREWGSLLLNDKTMVVCEESAALNSALSLVSVPYTVIKPDFTTPVLDLLLEGKADVTNSPMITRRPAST